ncbi:UNKNOWN [Stylonychia lemnae]|uniref:Uncharacterized protein n=1 Tax=Stylonychia lemnae TaxID=5949 RepID=A0A077ZUA5_STYLE|nr:UNKNOWN [Stylonychia lemnae]|eukprot:CDW72870.1 UNKNOWN [Stylonychia lemnae]
MQILNLECTSEYDCQKCDATNIAQCTKCTYPVNQRALEQSDTTNPCCKIPLIQLQRLSVRTVSMGTAFLQKTIKLCATV